MQLGDRFVRELATRFNEINDQFGLLNWIDREIVQSGQSIEQTIADILKRSKDVFHAKAASAYVVMSGKVLPFPQKDSCVPPMEADDAFLRQLSICTKPDVIPDDRRSVARLVLPVAISSIPSLRLMLAYEAPWYGANSSPFHDDDLKSFAEMACDQVAILLSKKIDAERHRIRDDAEGAYFAGVTRNDAFSLEQRWFDLTRNFRNFLPNWAPLRIEPEPQIQILTYDGKRQTLLLRSGTDDKEPRLARTLYVKDTICGILIEKEERDKSVEQPPLYVDPTTDDKEVRARYKAYLLDTDIPRSELVVPIRWSAAGEPKKTIALVNLEHSQPSVFSDTHIEIIAKAGELISPYVAALIHEEAQQRERDIAHIYMLHGILAKMATTYRHKIGQGITAATLSVEALESLGARLTGEEKKFFDRLDKSVRSFAELSSSFVSDLPNYVLFSEIALLPLVEAALNEFDPTGMKRAEDITMTLSVADDLDPGKDLQVFGSPLIREHVYNILYNSVYAVREHLSKRAIDQGSIAVSIYQREQLDKKGDPDAFPLVVVQIEDNGGGLSPEAQRKYGTFGHTIGKAGGTGYGVAAAREYLITIGGLFEWEHFDVEDGARKTRGLRQKLCFPFYVDRVHKDMANNFFGGSGNSGGKK
jgi:signal transduction histidine kinase